MHKHSNRLYVVLGITVMVVGGMSGSDLLRGFGLGLVTFGGANALWRLSQR